MLTKDQRVSLTDATSFHLHALEIFESTMALLDGVILHKAIRRLEGNLGQSAKSVKNIENITFRNFVA
jgi:hypothetical protein